MPFASQGEAKQFLVELIAREAEREGEALSDIEKRLLFYSVDEPKSAEGIPEEVLFDDDPDFEERASGLFESAYKNADPEDRKKIIEAIREVNKGDHYIAIMAKPVLARSTRVRDILLYVVIGITVTVLSLLYAAYR